MILQQIRRQHYAASIQEWSQRGITFSGRSSSRNHSIGKLGSQKSAPQEFRRSSGHETRHIARRDIHINSATFQAKQNLLKLKYVNHQHSCVRSIQNHWNPNKSAVQDDFTMQHGPQSQTPRTHDFIALGITIIGQGHSFNHSQPSWGYSP